MTKRPEDPSPSGDPKTTASQRPRKLSGDVELEVDLLRRAAAPAEHPASAHASNVASVLVVDDDPDMRRYVRRSLQRMDLPIGRVLEAKDASEALDILAANRIDLLITDLVLGGPDGLALTRAVRADAVTTNVAVLLMTGKASYRETVQVAREAGAGGLLIKPFNTAKLRDAVAPLIPHEGREGSR